MTITIWYKDRDRSNQLRLLNPNPENFTTRTEAPHRLPELRALKQVAVLWQHEAKEALVNFRALAEEYASGEYTYHVRGKPFKVQTTTESLAHSNIPRVALPKTKDNGQLYEFITKENAPGHFPYTAGVFPFKRTDE